MKILTLIDTSVWIDHFNSPIDRLQRLVDDRSVLCHPLIIGELACGKIPNRRGVLAFLSALHQAAAPEHEEVIRMVDALELYGRGLAWIDAHLIAAALLSGAYLYTHDKKLLAVASELGLLAPA